MRLPCPNLHPGGGYMTYRRRKQSVASGSPQGVRMPTPRKRGSRRTIPKAWRLSMRSWSEREALMRVLALAILDRDNLNRAGGRPDLRSGLSGLPARVRPGQLLRMPLHVAAPVQRDGIGPRGTVRHQSILRGRASRLSAVSPGLLSEPYPAVGSSIGSTAGTVAESPLREAASHQTHGRAALSHWGHYVRRSKCR